MKTKEQELVFFAKGKPGDPLHLTLPDFIRVDWVRRNARIEHGVLDDCMFLKVFADKEKTPFERMLQGEITVYEYQRYVEHLQEFSM